ncbi:hypothetical protein DTL42_13985 [Bremerella cremea]|uniref:Uncharacterized protein n=1 Tax=Bremerella cremea TaxID=1031537 RepID=A0A368KPP3_9BACT|nr:hypothetical protein [Bremerella cremea]RCS47630.1 hypothetical protein DTL42_13985 [Bremerella cremea]
MNPPTLWPVIVLLVAVAASATFAQEKQTSDADDTSTETVSKVEQEPAKSYDEMGFEELDALVKQLAAKLKDQESLGSGGAITEERIEEQQKANELREQLFKANMALRKKGAEIRQVEREKWLGHLNELTTRLDDMKRERFTILEKFYEASKAKYDAGRVGIDVALAAEIELADAEFELHGRDAYKTRMIRLREWQEEIEAGEANERRQEDYLKVKSQFLKTYIEYLKGTEESYREILKRYP